MNTQEFSKLRNKKLRDTTAELSDSALRDICQELYQQYQNDQTQEKMPLHNGFYEGYGFTLVENDGYVAHCSNLGELPTHVTFCVHYNNDKQNIFRDLYTGLAYNTSEFWHEYAKCIDLVQVLTRN